jgi:hypothetical protein
MSLDATKLTTTTRHYRDKDSKALKSFVTCITCVVLLSSSLSKLNDFIRILDTIHTVMIFYSIYW